MKTLISALMCSVFAISAYASIDDGACAKPSQKYVCSSSDFRIEFEVYAQKPWGQKVSAVLKARENRSMKLLTELPCFRKAPEKRAPDKVVPVIECYDPMTVDSGYRITQTTPDFAGVTWATVSQISIAGAQELAKVPCHKK